MAVLTAAAQPAGTDGAKPTPGQSAAIIPATGVRSLRAVAERTSRQLARQLYMNIPAMKEAISILAGLTGVPCLTGVDDAHTDELRIWAEDVGAGWSGVGMAAWLEDHIGQALWEGFAVAEGEVSASSDELIRLWSYRSEFFGFDYSDAGELAILQRNASGYRSGSSGYRSGSAAFSGGRVSGLVLDPMKAAVSTFGPQGGAPEGEPLFLACPTVGQVWVEALLAHKATWRRMGVPVYHVNLRLPENFQDDAEQTQIKALLTLIAENLNAGIQSQVERGVAKDVYTAGEVTISVIGLEGIAMDFQISKRQLMEEILVATGIPPSLFGYSWSSTERMSSVQMRKLIGRIWQVRRAVSPVIRHMVDLRQRLRGDARPWTMSWEDSNLADLVETAKAARDDTTAQLNALKRAERLWQLGIWTQEDVAEDVTGKREVAVPMAEPPSAPAPAVEPQDEADRSQEGEGEGETGNEASLPAAA